LGGSKIAVDMAGTVDNVAENEADAFDQVRRFLSYMPQNVWQMPPVIASSDPADRIEDQLLRIGPPHPRKPYKMRKRIKPVADRGSVFEIQPSFGRAVITSLARMNGKVVGIIANNPMIYGGAMDAAAARKQLHFVDLCDCFHIPIIFLVDVPGFMVGLQAEQNATLREGMRCLHAAMQATVPIVTVIIRKCYGMAGIATHHQKTRHFP